MIKKERGKNVLAGLIILIIFGLIIFSITIFNKNTPSKEELNTCGGIPLINYFSCENGTITCPDEECLNLLEIDKNTCNVEIVASERNNCYINLAKNYTNSDVCKYVINNSHNFWGRIEFCKKEVEKRKYIIDKSLNDAGTNYTKMINQIIICNANVIYENGVRNCYSQWDRGCYYAHFAKDCPNYGGQLEKKFELAGFTNEESLSLCEKFVSEGMKIDCINTFS